MNLVKQKLVAFGIHLAASITFVVSFLLLSYFVIYTPEIARLDGGLKVGAIVWFVDIMIGPMLTLIVYRRGKRGLLFDLIVIVTLQISAFGYGAWTLYSQRPLYLPYVVEHFKIMPAAEIDTDELVVEGLLPHPLAGPRMVYVIKPEGDDRTKILFDSVFGGKDIQYYPKLYRPFVDHLPEIRARSEKMQWDLESLRDNRPEVVEPIELALEQIGRTGSEVLLIPIVGHAAEATAILDRETGERLGYVDVTLW